MDRKILLIGGGGHCHSVLDSILSMNIYDDIGIVDKNINPYLDIPIVGSDDDIPDLIDAGWNEAFITVGSVGDTSIRRRLYEIIKKYKITIPVIIDPTAIIGRNVVIEEGVFIGKRTVVNTGTQIGKGSIINSGSIIEHDCKIGDFSHVSTGVSICGNVSIGNDSHVGAGSVIKQLIQIGDNVLIGAGSVVVRNLPNSVKAYGNPCRMVD